MKGDRSYYFAKKVEPESTFYHPRWLHFFGQLLLNAPIAEKGSFFFQAVSEHSLSFPVFTVIQQDGLHGRNSRSDTLEPLKLCRKVASLPLQIGS